MAAALGVGEDGAAVGLRLLIKPPCSVTNQDAVAMLMAIPRGGGPVPYHTEGSVLMFWHLLLFLFSFSPLAFCFLL